MKIGGNDMYDTMERRLAESKRKLDAVIEMTQDQVSLDRFITRKGIEYFNTAAARNPDQSGNYFRQAAAAGDVLLSKTADFNNGPAARDLLLRWTTARDMFREETNDCARRGIREFIAESPPRWKRLEGHSPERVGTLQPSSPLAISFEI